MSQESDRKMALQIFEEAGVIQTGRHVICGSGNHSDTYFNKDDIYKTPRKVSRLCQMIADNFCRKKVEVVVGPVMGGIALAQWTAFHLSSARAMDVLAVFADKTADYKRFVISRGYDRLVVDRHVLVVEDVLTTGASARMVVEAVRARGGEVIGVGALCNRGGVTEVDLSDVPELYSLINLRLDSWDPKKCPLCAQGIPYDMDVGHARESLASS